MSAHAKERPGRPEPAVQSGAARQSALSAALALGVTPRSDLTESLAHRFATTGSWDASSAPSGARSLSGPGAQMVQQAVAGPGRSLEPQIRSHFETKLGVGLGAVRVHTDAKASTSARALGAKAYTFGSDVVFSPGSYQPESRGGRELLAHELAHVVQQSASGTPVLAAFPDIGFWDVVDVVSPVAGEIGRASGLEGEDVLDYAARAVLGDTLWDVLHAFARGFLAGLRNARKDQLKRISDKFSDLGLSDAGEFAAGYAFGVPKGLWYELRDLFEAIKTLLGLPGAISRFLTQTLPKLAARLGQLMEQPGGLRDQLKRVNEAFAKDPSGFMAQVDRLFDAARAAILAEIEKRGQDAASRALSFLDEPWGDIGEDVGELTGRVLFEVLLAVGTEAIGNFIKEALVLAGKVAGTVVEGVLDVVRGVGKLFGTMLEWLEGLVARVAGQAGELFDALRGLVAGLRRGVGELGAAEVEAAGAGGAAVRMPAAEAGRGGAMEARALERPPGSPTVNDLYGRTPKTAEPKVDTRPDRSVSDKPPKEGGSKGPRTLTPKEQHRIELEKGIEEFLASGGEIQKIDRTWHWHHLLPQEFRAMFEKAGIDIEKYLVRLDPETHLKHVHGGAPEGGLWNQTWQGFFGKTPTPTKAQIEAQLTAMRKQFGI